MTEVKRQVLGRGLSSLLGDPAPTPGEGDVLHPVSLATNIITSGRNQPRQHFSEEELADLAFSIEEKGVLQPILVRPHPEEEGHYEIVAGERRWRAAKRVGITQIPAIIKDLTDGDALEIGLLENIQRQDLNPIEEAEGYQRLAKEFHYTQEDLSRKLGKSRSHIANTLRLLSLSNEIRDLLQSGKLSSGQARTLIGAKNPEQLAERILNEGLTVREAESLSKSKKSTKKKGESKPSKDLNPELEVLKSHLETLLNVPVDLLLKGKGGKIVIPFVNFADLDQLIGKLNKLS